MQDASYYDDAASAGPAAPAAPADQTSAEAAPETDQTDQEGSDEEAGTALLPKSFFPAEPEPGQTYSVKIERVHDDQVECSLESNDKEEQSEAPAETAPPPPDAMME